MLTDPRICTNQDYKDPYDDARGPLRMAEARRQEIIELMAPNVLPVPVRA